MTPPAKRTLEWMLKVKSSYNLTISKLRNWTKTFLEPKFFSIYSQIKKIRVYAPLTQVIRNIFIKIILHNFPRIQKPFCKEATKLTIALLVPVVSYSLHCFHK